MKAGIDVKRRMRHRKRGPPRMGSHGFVVGSVWVRFLASFVVYKEVSGFVLDSRMMTRRFAGRGHDPTGLLQTQVFMGSLGKIDGALEGWVERRRDREKFTKRSHILKFGHKYLLKGT